MSSEGTARLAIDAAPADAGAPTVVHCAGAWTVHGIAGLEQSAASFAWPTRGEVVIDGAALATLDTSGAWLLHRTALDLERGGCTVRVEGLRPEFDSLLRLIGSREVATLAPIAEAPGWFARLGGHAWRGLLAALDYFAFVGEASLVLLRSIAQPHRLRWRVILHNMQSAGVEALPITGFLSFLMGVVIAYQGADQLQRFGADIFVMDLVALAMLRELSPLLTAIIVAGRSGSAYTAQIGTMKVTEEIDALRTDRRRAAGTARRTQDGGARHGAAAAHRLYGHHGRDRRHGHGARQARHHVHGLSRSPPGGYQPVFDTGLASARHRCSL